MRTKFFAKIVLSLAAVLIAALGMQFVSCSGMPSSQKGSGQEVRLPPDQSFQTDVEKRGWFLTHLRYTDRVVTIDRSQMLAGGFADGFSISFEEMVFGRAWPNTFRAPFTREYNKQISIGFGASTMMASFIEIEGLEEFQFLNYLHSVNRWDIVDGNLELYAITDEGIEVVLVFINNDL